MGDRRRPKRRPGNLITIQYQQPIPKRRGSVLKIKNIKISRFNNYGELELYLLENFGGGHRVYPGGADYPVITYTKYSDPYNDMNNVERQLRTESWNAFSKSVYHIIVTRVKA